MKVGDKVNFAWGDIELPSEGFEDGQIVVNYLNQKTGYKLNGIMLDSICFATAYGAGEWILIV